MKVMQQRDELQRKVSELESLRAARAASRDNKRGAGDLLRWQADYAEAQRQLSTQVDLNRQLRNRQAGRSVTTHTASNTAVRSRPRLRARATE